MPPLNKNKYSQTFHAHKYKLLLSFMALFVVVVGYIIITSQAATAPINIAGERVGGFEAENMSGGGVVVGIKYGTSGKARKLTDSTPAKTNFTVSKASTKFAIIARGALCQSTVNLDINFDGIQKKSLTLSSSGWSSYVTGVALTSGSHSVTITLTNPAKVGTCTRAAIIDNAIIVNDAPATPYKINTWAPQFQGFGTTGVATDYHPEKFKIVIGDKTIQNLVPSLQAAQVKVLIYLNGSFKNKQDLGPNGNDSTYKSDYPTASYAHTITGSQISEGDFPANKLMNPLDSSWRNSLYKKCQYYFSQSSYNGCFFDTIGTAPISASYVTPGLAINTATGALWTDSTWLAAVNNNIALVKSKLPGKLVYGNGLSNGKRYYTSTSALMNSLDAAMAEQFVMPKDAGPSDSEVDWKKNVNMLVDAATRQKPILAETKAWDGASRAVKDKRHKYALATFLLGSSNYTYFNFQYDHTTTSPSTWQTWWDADYGQPTGSYIKDTSGVYVRTFEKAKAVVNPTTSTITYNLGASYHAIDGATSTTSVTLAPRTAEIFLK